jgi:hypothetical protein
MFRSFRVQNPGIEVWQWASPFHTSE